MASTGNNNLVVSMHGHNGQAAQLAALAATVDALARKSNAHPCQNEQAASQVEALMEQMKELNGRNMQLAMDLKSHQLQTASQLTKLQAEMEARKDRDDERGGAAKHQQAVQMALENKDRISRLDSLLQQSIAAANKKREAPTVEYVEKVQFDALQREFFVLRSQLADLQQAKQTAVSEATLQRTLIESIQQTCNQQTEKMNGLEERFLGSIRFCHDLATVDGRLKTVEGRLDASGLEGEQTRKDLNAHTNAITALQGGAALAKNVLTSLAEPLSKLDEVRGSLEQHTVQLGDLRERMQELDGLDEKGAHGAHDPLELARRNDTLLSNLQERMRAYCDGQLEETNKRIDARIEKERALRDKVQATFLELQSELGDAIERMNRVEDGRHERMGGTTGGGGGGGVVVGVGPKMQTQIICRQVPISGGGGGGGGGYTELLGDGATGQHGAQMRYQQYSQGGGGGGGGSYSHHGATQRHRSGSAGRGGGGDDCPRHEGPPTSGPHKQERPYRSGGDGRGELMTNGGAGGRRTMRVQAMRGPL